MTMARPCALSIGLAALVASAAACGEVPPRASPGSCDPDGVTLDGECLPPLPTCSDRNPEGRCPGAQVCSHGICDTPRQCGPVAPARRVCQLVGAVEPGRSDLRKYFGGPDPSYGVWGTDLGFPVEDGRRTFFLFGDTWRMPPGDNGFPPTHAGPDDSIAYSLDRDPEDCLDLQFVTRDGSVGPFLSPSVVPPIDQGPLSVPAAGFMHDDALHVLFLVPDHLALARSFDDGRSFELLYHTGSDKLVHVSVAVATAPAALGIDADDALLIWGRPVSPTGPLYLAWHDLDSIEAAWEPQFFVGTTPEGHPRWSADESDARPLYAEEEPCTSPTSVAFDPVLERWIMLYGCPAWWLGELHTDAGGTLLRQAAHPWGPWSDPQLVFEPGLDGGYCEFMHAPPPECADSRISDPRREDQPGFEYAPIVLPGYTRAVGAGSRMYFSISTWNPYSVALMRVDLGCEPQD